MSARPQALDFAQAGAPIAPSGMRASGSSLDGPLCRSHGGRSDSGFTYASPRRRPQWTHVAVQCEPLASTVPITSPGSTSSPSSTVAVTGSYVVRRGGSPVPVRATETTPLPATRPAKETRPAATVRTGVPAGAARSTPRCPRP